MQPFPLLDLFSGVGAFSLGLERTGGFETVAFCEINPFRHLALNKHWPHTPIYDDILALTAERLRADGIVPRAICGGFPCQDLSAAGSRAGIDGERSGLWREYARLIRELRPDFAFVENTSALLDGGLGRVLADLAALGYDAEWHCIPAAHIGAPHERDRVWLVAYPNEKHGEAGLGIFAHHQTPLFQEKDRNSASVWLAPPSVPPRVGHGPADWLDRRERTEALGDSLVPQIATMLGNNVLAALAACH